MDGRAVDRRTFLRASAATGAAAIAGCLERFETQSIWTGGPIVEDRPDAVYLPAASEEMGTYDVRTLEDGSQLSLHFTYPHRFWTVTGEEPQLVEVAEGEIAHLMTSVWDPDAGRVLPRRPRATIASASGSREGDGDSDGDAGPAEQYQFWPMLAQRMGYHFGNNVAFADDGDHEVRIDLDPLGVRGVGGYAERFERGPEITVPVEFSAEDVLSLDVERVDRERRGDRDAFEPMDGMGPPPGRVPAADDLPGRSLGTGRSGDAVVAATVLDAPPAGVDGDGPYLVASPRTPYNRIALPGCSMAAEADGADAVDLVESLGPDLGHHYGAVLDADPDEVALRFDAPPQVARHDGYETAFFGMEPVTLGGD